MTKLNGTLPHTLRPLVSLCCFWLESMVDSLKNEWRLQSNQVFCFFIFRRVNKNEAGKPPFSYFILVLFTIQRVVLTVKFVAFNPKKFAELVRFLQVVLHWETKILFWLSGWYGCKTNDQLKETIQLMFFYIFTLHFGLS